jgi:glycosyltransferase involved in cell wall biosynthesis
VRDVAALVNAFRPDVMHVHNTFPLLSPAVYWEAASRGVPVVQTLHNFRLLCANALLLRGGRVCEACVGRVPWRAVVHRCYRDSAAASGVVAGMLAVHRAIGTFRNKVSRYIALSEFGRRKLVEGGLPADRIDIKPNFVEIPAAPEPKPRKGALFVGRLSREKGLAVLRSAVEQVPGLNVDVVGAGPDADLLEGCSQTRLAGQESRDAVYRRMRDAAYLVLPSIWYEAFPLVLVEAFACGLPVIASNLGALSHIVSDGKTGLLFESGSADDLREKLRWAEAHPAEMRRMGDQARLEYESKYTPEVNYRQLTSIYALALDQSGRAGRR